MGRLHKILIQCLCADCFTTQLAATGGILDQYAASAQAQTTDPVSLDSNAAQATVSTEDASANVLPDIDASNSVSENGRNVNGQPAQIASCPRSMYRPLPNWFRCRPLPLRVSNRLTFSKALRDTAPEATCAPCQACQSTF